MIKIVIDGIPVAKGRGKVGRLPNGRPVVFTPSKTRLYENTLRLKASEVMAGMNPLDEALNVTIIAYVPIPASMSKKKQELCRQGKIRPIKRPDGDNFLKAAMDGCNGIVFRDDSVAVDLHVSKRYSDKPRLEIEVKRVNED